MSIADDIRAENDLPREKVPTPEWKSCPVVWVRTLFAGERDAFEQNTLVKKGKTREANLLGLRARLVVATAQDEARNQLFTESDIPWLNNKSAKVLDRIFTVAQRLSGMTADDVEELVKN